MFYFHTNVYIFSLKRIINDSLTSKTGNVVAWMAKEWWSWVLLSTCDGILQLVFTVGPAVFVKMLDEDMVWCYNDCLIDFSLSRIINKENRREKLMDTLNMPRKRPNVSWRSWMSLSQCGHMFLSDRCKSGRSREYSNQRRAVVFI